MMSREIRVTRPEIIRFFHLLLNTLIITHWIGCVYLGIANWKGFGTTDWLPPLSLHEEPFSTQYLYSMFWSINVITHIGNGVVPTNNFEIIISLIVAIVSTYIVAIIIGSISGILDQMNHNTQLYKRKMNTVKLFMRNRKLPDPLCARIYTYYTNTWFRTRGIEDSAILRELPHNLRVEVALCISQSIIQTSHLFRKADKHFLEALCTYLTPRIASPGDGTFLTSFYFHSYIPFFVFPSNFY